MEIKCKRLSPVINMNAYSPFLYIFFFFCTSCSITSLCWFLFLPAFEVGLMLLYLHSQIGFWTALNIHCKCMQKNTMNDFLLWVDFSFILFSHQCQPQIGGETVWQNDSFRKGKLIYSAYFTHLNGKCQRVISRFVGHWTPIDYWLLILSQIENVTGILKISFWI